MLFGLAPADLALFSAASLALAAAPGPDNLFVLQQSLRHGWRVGCTITLGLCSGLVAHIAAVTLGVAAVLANSPAAAWALRLFGAGYLLYLAWQAWRSRTLASAQQARSHSGWRWYGQGIIMNLSNPKVAIFFLAFLPQFTQADRGSVAGQMVLLGLAFMATAFVVLVAIAVAADRLAPWLLASPQAQRRLQHLAALVFAFLALRLLFQS